MSRTLNTIFYPINEKPAHYNKENINYESPLKHHKTSQVNHKKLGNQLLSFIPSLDKEANNKTALGENQQQEILKSFTNNNEPLK